MSRKNGRDYLYLIWKHPETRRHYIVGILSKNGVFEFEYGPEFSLAKTAGFNGIEAFKEIDKKYQSEKLFPVFASRLPDRKRRDIDKILQKYNLDEYDEYLLLKKSGAKLPIDAFQFVDPILADEYPVSRNFNIAGVRYYLPCNGKDCTKQTSVDVDEHLYLSPELSNEHDPNAVVVYNSKKEKIGYIPRYYAKPIQQMIKENRKITCIVTDVNKNNTYSQCLGDCIKVNLYIE
ncbi:MAG: HIRAN domain-containing protein [Acutalibacteraceae bacterium]